MQIPTARKTPEMGLRRVGARRSGLALALPLILALGGCHTAARVGRRAPDFTVRTAQGERRTLASYHGRVLILNFWATWCPPCLEEIPSLNRLHQRIQGLPVSILAISIDQNRKQYRKFLQDWKIGFATARDPSAAIMHRYGTKKIPETYIIGPHGRVKRKIVSASNWTDPEMVRYLTDLARGKVS